MLHVPPGGRDTDAAYDSYLREVWGLAGHFACHFPESCSSVRVSFSSDDHVPLIVCLVHVICFQISCLEAVVSGTYVPAKKHGIGRAGQKQRKTLVRADLLLRHDKGRASVCTQPTNSG